MKLYDRTDVETIQRVQFNPTINTCTKYYKASLAANHKLNKYC